MLAQRETIRQKYEATIELLGVPATVISVKGGGSVQCTVGFKSSNDEALIAAYGVGVKVVTVRQCDVALVEKLDAVTVGDNRFTINEVFPVYLNELLVGWRCVIRGK